jgi:hypothetical protein
MLNNINIFIVMFFLLSCSKEGTDSFTFAQAMGSFHPKTIVDGFNDAVSENITGYDFKIQQVRKTYKTEAEALDDLRKYAKEHNQFWDPKLKIMFAEFSADASRFGVDITDFSNDRFLGILLVDELTPDATGDTTAVCIRTNYFVAGGKQDKFYRIEILKDKYDEILENIQKEKDSTAYEGQKYMPSEIIRRRIVYHEFMHCSFHVSHLPKEPEFKGDIMYPSYSRFTVLSSETWEVMLGRNFNPDILEKMPYVK